MIGFICFQKQQSTYKDYDRTLFKNNEILRNDLNTQSTANTNINSMPDNTKT